MLDNNQNDGKLTLLILILNFRLLLSDSFSSKLIPDLPFCQIGRGFGKRLIEALGRILKLEQYPESFKMKFTPRLEETRYIAKTMQNVCYEPKHFATISLLRISPIHLKDKKNVGKEKIHCGHRDNLSDQLRLMKKEWINLSYVWPVAQMSYSFFHIIAILCLLTIKHCTTNLITIKESFTLASYRFVNGMSQFFTPNYLKMMEGRSFCPPLMSSFTRFLFLYICFAGFQLKHVDAAKGGFKCSSPTAQTACLPSNYSKFELPNPGGINPIAVEILIEEVLRINDKDYSITFSCYYNINWPDKRITLTKEFGKEQLKPGMNVTMNPDIIVPMNLEMTKDLWLPNVMIYNLKTYKVMDVLSKLAGLWITADYTVSYSEATHITFICPMHFDKFPLDTQSCKFLVGSYSYDDSQMTFKTQNAKYNNKDSNSIALDYEIEIKPLSAEDSLLVFEGLGNFSLAGFELVLRRYVSTYIITYYLPSGLFVIVSWISFLIPMDVIPGRMALLVTLFLVLVNIFNNVTTNTPKAEGLTAIEAWMLACILFVFGALIE